MKKLIIVYRKLKCSINHAVIAMYVNWTIKFDMANEDINKWLKMRK